MHDSTSRGSKQVRGSLRRMLHRGICCFLVPADFGRSMTADGEETLERHGVEDLQRTSLSVGSVQFNSFRFCTLPHPPLALTRGPAPSSFSSLAPFLPLLGLPLTESIECRSHCNLLHRRKGCPAEIHITRVIARKPGLSLRTSLQLEEAWCNVPAMHGLNWAPCKRC